MRVELIAVPYDSARRGERLGAGPEHLLEAGIADRLTEAGHEARVRVLDAPSTSWRAEIRTAFDLARGVAAAVEEALAGGAFPLVLSGNCGPAAIGCVAGLKGSPGVVWFDAHGDFNTPETTIGGYLDGMCLATLTGRCWTQLAAAIPGFQPVAEQAVILIGARDLDPLEERLLARSGVRRVATADLRGTLPAALLDMDLGGRPVYLHLDLDVLDPGEAVISPYRAPNGLSRVDLDWAIEAIARAVPIRAAALTAYDPGSDSDGRGRDAALTLGLALVNAAKLFPRSGRPRH